MEYKNTVLLPKTSFAMKANLAKTEHEWLAFWEKIGLYNTLRQKSAGRPKFVLHFGPPYANGHTHIGHSLTYVLKDILNKLYQMSGYDAAIIPGWDCHGLPIELKVEENYRAKGQKKEDISPVEFIGECRKFAAKWIDIQKTELKRLGFIARWDDPYCTMDFKFESGIVRELFKFVEKDSIYRGLKPVMWSVVEQTALAEAEVEYKDHVSDAIYVGFPVVKTKIASLQPQADNKAMAVIWTTTPWSLPGNRAIAYGKDFEYTIIKVLKGNDLIKNDLRLLVARDLLENFCQKTDIRDYEILEHITGDKLIDTLAEHPWCQIGYDFKVPLLDGCHVTVEAGTGLVHTAPTHGVEDFVLCNQHNIETPQTIQGDGTYYPHIPIFAGQHVYKVNGQIINKLKEVSALLHAEKITHSYPHSWRSKAPLIYRATSQWFVSMEKNNLRQTALAQIDQVNWFPAQGKNRITAMVTNRPDWCLSRQRTWGVPITIFVHNATGKVLKDQKVYDRIAQAIAKEGVEAWYKYDAQYFLQSDYAAADYEKVQDILDVWFDSGCTHNIVLPDLQWPADVYFEGSDQHRGWFQSSLLEACATNEKAPYKNVITHGFALDENGRKMSKSEGNVIAPAQVIDTMGADILRLWIALSDYKDDIRVGNNILKQCEDVYRRFRNTFRYLLGALDGFEPKQAVDYKNLPDIEKWILHQLALLEQKRLKVLQDYDFAAFYNALHNFCAVDLSAFYFDIRKDRLYCDHLQSVERRATQTVIWHTLRSLTLWLAPVLSFTAEEVWQNLFIDPNGAADSVHLQSFNDPVTEWLNEAVAEKFDFIRSVRKIVNCAIELERSAKTIGSSLQAHVILHLAPEIFAKAQYINWEEIAIVSKVTLVAARPPANAFTIDGERDIGVLISAADGEKCPRCWQIKSEVITQNICNRCYQVVHKN